MNTATAERIQKLVTGAMPAHGTRARYKRGCACLQCKAANSRYVCDRDRARKEGDTRELVPAEKARQHIHALGRAGVGYKLVAEESRVSRTIIGLIRRGVRKQIRAHTERAILAVTQKCDRFDRSLVPGGPTWKILDKLIDRGYSRTQLAKWMGSKAKVPSLQLRRDFVTAKSAANVRKMYEKVNDGLLRRDR